MADRFITATSAGVSDLAAVRRRWGAISFLVLRSPLRDRPAAGHCPTGDPHPTEPGTALLVRSCPGDRTEPGQETPWKPRTWRIRARVRSEFLTWCVAEMTGRSRVHSVKTAAREIHGQNCRVLRRSTGHPFLLARSPSMQCSPPVFASMSGVLRVGDVWEVGWSFNRDGRCQN